MSSDVFYDGMIIVAAVSLLASLIIIALPPMTAQSQTRISDMHVTMHTIPHDQQRYNTVGDWHFDMNGDLIIKVSEMSDPRYETLIAVHELIEAVLCKQAGVSEADVDAWDREHPYLGEPGGDPQAPYHHQHMAASMFEEVLAKRLGVDWKAYDAEVMSK